MSTNYLFCAFDHVREAKDFFQSMKKTEGTIEPICLMYEPQDDVDLPENGRLIPLPKRYAGNTGRLKDVSMILPQLNLDKNAWFFFTDVHDVIFQRPIPELPTSADIFVCSEGKKFKEIDFWKERLPKSMQSWEAYNVGTFAMRYEPFVEFLSQLEESWYKFLSWYHKPSNGRGEKFPHDMIATKREIKDSVARIYNSYADTFVFNNYLHTTRYRVKEMAELFTCFGYNYELKNIVVKDGLTYTRDGQLVSIIHYNGNTKLLKGQLAPKG